MRRDPIGIEGGFNLYSLSSNSPVDSIDYVGWEEISECQTLSYNKDASVPAWLLNVGRSFGIHEIKGSVSISGKYANYVAIKIKKGTEVSISGNYNATVEIGTPALKGLGAKFRLGWYGKTTADGSIGIDYPSRTGGIRPSLNASVSIELGLVMQISDKKEKYIGATIQGGAGLTFTPEIDRFSDKGFDLSVYVNFYATISIGFYLGLFSYSFESRYESDKTLFYSIPVRF